jgi:ADP-heptose:LPS heptosyltransferase
MMIRTRAALGMLGARWHYRKVREPLVTFTGVLSGARNILIVMPLDGSPLYPVAPVVTMLRAHFTEEQISVVVSEHSTEALEALRHSPVIRILPSEITPWMLPRHDVLVRAGTRHHDVAIDLNLDFLLPSGYICRETRTPVRIGFARKGADLFYNLQVQTGPAESRTQRYERMANCLLMF